VWAVFSLDRFDRGNRKSFTNYLGVLYYCLSASYVFYLPKDYHEHVEIKLSATETLHWKLSGKHATGSDMGHCMYVLGNLLLLRVDLRS
jgi:hypothetical protein